MKVPLKDLWVNVLDLEDCAPALYSEAFTIRREAIDQRPSDMIDAKDSTGLPIRILRTAMKTMTLQRYTDLMNDYAN